MYYEKNCLFKPCLMSEDRLPLYCVYKGISPQMVHTFMKTKYSSLKARSSMQNNPGRVQETNNIQFFVVVACVSLILTASGLQCYNSVLALIVLMIATLLMEVVSLGYSTICTRHFAISDTTYVCMWT